MLGRSGLCLRGSALRVQLISSGVIRVATEAVRFSDSEVTCTVRQRELSGGGVLNCYLGRSHPKNLRGTLLTRLCCPLMLFLAASLSFLQSFWHLGCRARTGGREAERGGRENSGLIFSPPEARFCAVPFRVWVWLCGCRSGSGCRGVCAFPPSPTRYAYTAF